MSRKHLAIGVALIGLTAAGSLIAHPDDPKARDTQRRYEGPGYRRDAAGPDKPGPEFPADGVMLYSWLPCPEFGNHTWANTCWGYVSPSGREYALIGLSDGTGFVDITAPGNASIVGVVAGPNSVWRDFKVYGHHAYAVSEGGGGIQVISMEQIDQGIVTLVNTVTTGGTARTHTVNIDEDSGFLYRCGGQSNGLRIYDLANPVTPVLVGSWSDRYVHEAQVVTYFDGPYAGRQIAFCCGGLNGGWTQTGLTILDVTNKSNIIELAHLQYSTGEYSHQGWLSPDRRYFFLGDELDEQNRGFTTRTRIINVEDLSNPFEVGWFTNGNTAVDHNLYTKDHLIFAANYRSGLRVFDASDPEAPVEIAYFDTYPADDAPQFNGLWSNYPYFPSGTVIGSDRERGLFVWRLGSPLLTFEYPDGRPDLIDPTGGTEMLVRILPRHHDPKPGTALLHVDAGEGFIAYPLTPVKGDLHRAVFPAASCETVIRYYLSSETMEDETYLDPIDAPAAHYTAFVASGELLAFHDDFETDLGWTVSGDAVDGHWERGVPIGGGTRGDPPTDGDGSGQCYLTANRPGNSDVDDGSTLLTSPRLDASGGNAFVSYWRWYDNTAGSNPNADVFVVEISNNDGQTWVTLETVGPAGPQAAGGWYHVTHRIADFVEPTDQVRLRFIASDLGQPSVVEAAVDGVAVNLLTCHATEITGYEVAFGQWVSGDLSSLLASDDVPLRMRSRFGFTALEPNLIELRVDAATSVPAPANQAVIGIESRINHASGTARLRLRDQQTEQLVLVGQWAVSNTDQLVEFTVSEAHHYVDEEGRIELRIRKSVVATFTALGFDSFIDLVSVRVD